MTQIPTNKARTGPTVIRQTEGSTFGEHVTPSATSSTGRRLNPNFALSISCATNPQKPRNFDDGLWEAGSPAAWYENRLEPIIRGSDAGMVFLRNPGGMDAGSDLLFNQLSWCAAQSGTITDHVTATKMLAMSEHAEWAYVCGEIRKLGKRVALYLGAVRQWDKLPAQQIIYKVHQELDPFAGSIDEVYVDSANDATEDSAYPIVARVCRELGLVCGAENRAIKGAYPFLMNHPHCIKGTYWDSTGKGLGSGSFAPFTSGTVCWILSDEQDRLGAKATQYRRETGRVSASVWDGLRASDVFVENPG